MDPRLVTVLIITFCFLSVGMCLKCRSCSGVNCVDKTEEDCPGVGVTKYGCACCKICAKGLGDRCGGPFNIAGICGRDLECVKSSPPEGEDSGIYLINSRGICQKKT
ncbi:single insulin-like growth factor-binding domain protein-2 isoform X3 [Centruroides vittatus]|uniref:single insulin-like growth factor-binding domain protein-2 isoform X3 n=1 Tax=Centruroides vittatus TaxID=120091 RepID=UPI00350F97D5